MKNVAVGFVFAMASVSGLGFCFYVLMTTDQITPHESQLYSILISLFSVLSSWLISGYFSSSNVAGEKTKLIDTVAKQSSAKILIQSDQLRGIQREISSFLKSEPKDMETVRVFLRSMSAMVEQIRKSNAAFPGDWKGVASEDIRIEIDEQIRATIDPETVDAEPVTSSGSDQIVNKLSHKTKSLKDGVTGDIEIEVSRHTFKLHFVESLPANKFDTPPSIRATCIQAPYGAPAIEKIGVFAKTGTTHDFHIMAKSNEYNISLPSGKYTFKYKASKQEAIEKTENNVQQVAEVDA